MTHQEMQQESMKIVMQFNEAGATQEEGMVILAMTLAIVFRTNKVSQHEAISRFTTVVRQIYQGEMK